MKLFNSIVLIVFILLNVAVPVMISLENDIHPIYTILIFCCGVISLILVAVLDKVLRTKNK
jgi:hypothetical protein